MSLRATLMSLAEATHPLLRSSVGPERPAHNGKAVGSSPTGATTPLKLNRPERSPCKREVSRFDPGQGLHAPMVHRKTTAASGAAEPGSTPGRRTYHVESEAREVRAAALKAVGRSARQGFGSSALRSFPVRLFGKTLGLGLSERGSNPRRGAPARIAQRTERGCSKPMVAGSTPAASTSTASPSGGTGRRARLKSGYREVSRFDSGGGHEHQHR